MKPSTLLKLFFSAPLLLPVGAHAVEMPYPKLGLWEIRMHNSFDGAALIAKGATQICRDAARERLEKTAEEASKKECSKYEVRKEGLKWIANSVCKIDGSTVSTLMTSEFNGETACHADTNSTFSPAEDGNSRFRMVMDGKWLGPCK